MYWSKIATTEKEFDAITKNNYRYLVFVHGETSNSTLNPLEALVELANRNDVKLCADCI